MFATCSALAPKLNVGVETLRKWVVQAQIDAGTTSGSSSAELEEIKKREPGSQRGERDLESGIDFLREGARPSPPLIVAFIDEMRGRGFGVESTCAVLREQGVAVAPRSYRAVDREQPPQTRDGNGSHHDRCVPAIQPMLDVRCPCHTTKSSSN